MLSLKTKNLNLCVADRDASAVFEVDQAGQLLFRYTRFHYITKKLFRPYGIITYRKCRVLTSDFNNLYIQILNEVGFKLQSQVQVPRWSSNKVNFSVYI